MTNIKKQTMTKSFMNTQDFTTIDLVIDNSYQPQGILINIYIHYYFQFFVKFLKMMN